MVEWIDKPIHQLNIENHWQKFVRRYAGEVLSDRFGTSPNFKNADFIFHREQIVIELKEIQTEFLDGRNFQDESSDIALKALKNNEVAFSDIFNCNLDRKAYLNYIKSVKPNIQRILKKANKQIKETKQYFNYTTNTGIAVLVVDGFTALSFQNLIGLIGNILSSQFSSIDACIVMTVNEYLAMPNSNIPCTMWCPMYSDKADKNLHVFINELGKKWRLFLEFELGPADISFEQNELDLNAPINFMKRVLNNN